MIDKLMSQSVDPDNSDYPAYTMRKSGQAVMIEIVQLTKNARAFPYFNLVEVESDPSGTVILKFVGAWVTLKGRNLAELKDRLLEHKIGKIREGSSRIDDLSEKETFIEKIVITEPENG